MRSKPLPTVNSDSDLLELAKTKAVPAHLQSLHTAGIKTLGDLVWALPLRLSPMPKLKPFSQAAYGEMFLGIGKIIHREIKPAFGRKSRSRFLLHNGFIIVKDFNSEQTLTLRFFNIWPVQKKQLEDYESIWFLGELQEWRAQHQIINPKFANLIDENWAHSQGEWLIEYPTINKVPGSYTQKLIKNLPKDFWNHIQSEFSTDDVEEFKLSEAFQVLHGLKSPSEVSPRVMIQATERLAYEEFYADQLKIITRRRFIKKKKAPSIMTEAALLESLTSRLPFELTEDQKKAIAEIEVDLQSGHPMMRMLQGDVGCGKTIIAFLVALCCIKKGFQVALMCPTESLALQHKRGFDSLFGDLPEVKLSLALGSMKQKDKTILQMSLRTGETHLVIGTHALFQESIEFQNLGLAIIDEQHKFGVEQRLRLTAKGSGTHCLIMSATPIPRTLSLAQYGDLDFTTIKTMPLGRRGIKSRFVEKVNHDKYIEFLKQRLAQGDQGYFVFPAIEESENMSMQNVTEALEHYKGVFKDHKIAALHGKMKASEKDEIISSFEKKQIHILISTSVIEVGINVPNATFMSVYDPERFGLSSLHQLRGRVGRGDKAGFFFMVPNKELSPEAHKRLEVLEQTNNGFEIAEADLQNRGEGDLFGVDQSGVGTRRRVADFMKHSHVLEKVYSDLRKQMTDQPEKIDPILIKLARDQKILDTI